MNSCRALSNLRPWQEWFFEEGSVRMQRPRLYLRPTASTNPQHFSAMWVAVIQILWYNLVFGAGSVFFRRSVSNGLTSKIFHANKLLPFLNKAYRQSSPTQSSGDLQLKKHQNEQNREFKRNITYITKVLIFSRSTCGTRPFVVKCPRYGRRIFIFEKHSPRASV